MATTRTLSVHLENLLGANVEGVELTLKLENDEQLGAETVIISETSTSSDASGDASFTVLPNGIGSQNTSYRMIGRLNTVEVLNVTFKMPDNDADLHDLIASPSAAARTTFGDPVTFSNTATFATDVTFAGGTADFSGTTAIGLTVAAETLAATLAAGNETSGANIIVTAGDQITTDTINETTTANGVSIDSVLFKDGAVDLTESNPSAPGANVGRFFAADDNGFTTLHFVDENDVDLQLNRDLVHAVRNTTGSTLTKGSVVYINGSNGTIPTVALADASAESTALVLGLVVADIANNATGRVIEQGDLGGLDTSAFTEGDRLYLSETAGELTATAPSSPALVVPVGTVVVDNPSNGKIEVDRSSANHPLDNIALLDQANVFTGTVDLTNATVSLNSSDVSHDNTTGYVAAEHIDWTSDQGATNIADANIAASSVTQHETSIDHDALANFVADEHVAHSGVTLTAGAGLTGGGDISASRSFAVGAGTGITVNADDVEIDASVVALLGGTNTFTGTVDLTGATVSLNSSDVSHDGTTGFVADEHVAHSSISITAGSGLTGGGTIDGNVTLNIGAGTGVTVNANDIAIGQDVATTANVTFASVTIGGQQMSDILISSDGASTSDTALVTAGYVDANAGAGTLADLLSSGNTTGGTDVVVTSGDAVYGSAGVIEVRDGVNAQSIEIYGTYTDASNNELISIAHDGTDGVIDVQANGTGTLGNLSFKFNGTEKAYIDTDGVLDLVSDAGFNNHKILTSPGLTFRVDRNRKVYEISGDPNGHGGTGSVIFGSQAGQSGPSYGHTVIGNAASASGDWRMTAIGSNAAASANGAIALGTSKTNQGPQARIPHVLAIHGQSISSVEGDHQFLLGQMTAETADATATDMECDDTGSEFTLESGQVFFFEAHICGIQSDGSDAAHYVRRGIIANLAGTTALIGSVQTVGTDYESNSSTDVSVTADDTNDALKITVTGIASEDWNWGANIFVKEMVVA